MDINSASVEERGMGADGGGWSHVWEETHDLQMFVVLSLSSVSALSLHGFVCERTAPRNVIM